GAPARREGRPGMSPAERAYRLALLAYPAAYRRERGLEILTTILDGSDRRWPRGRELAAVVLDGVGRRGVLAGGGSNRVSARAGVRLAAFAWLFPIAVVNVSLALYASVGPEWVGGGPGFWSSAYFALMPLLALLTLTRSWWWGPLITSVAGVVLSTLGVPWAATWPWEDMQHPWQQSTLFALSFAPGIACVLARPRPGEPGDRRSLFWVPGAIIAGAALAWQGLFFSSWLGIPIVASLVAGLVFARRDSRLAVAAACVASLAFADRLIDPYGQGPTWLGAGTAVLPLLAALALASLWRMRPAVA
ncbi:MAG: hypothetical protein QOE87_3757, partial [Gaiellales bacterium]|nr:hypothetical protein [Gaiellales bacterium]